MSAALSFATMSRTERQQLQSEVAGIIERAAEAGDDLGELWREYRDTFMLVRYDQKDVGQAYERVKERLSEEKLAATLPVAEKKLKAAEDKLNGASELREKLATLQKQLDALIADVKTARGQVLRCEQAKVRARNLAPRWRRELREQRIGELQHNHMKATMEIRNRIEFVTKVQRVNFSSPAALNESLMYAEKLGVPIHVDGNHRTVDQEQWRATVRKVAAELPDLQQQLREREEALKVKIAECDNLLDCKAET